MGKYDPTVYTWSEMPEQIVNAGAKRKTVDCIGCTLAMNYQDPGEPSKEHDHPHTQISYVIEGEGESICNGVRRKVNAGSLVVIPPNLPHCFQVTGEKTALILDIFAPERQEHVAAYQKVLDEKGIKL